jgi:hypothetical protein
MRLSSADIKKRAPNGELRRLAIVVAARWTRTALWCGAVAGPLFLLVATLLGATRRRYDATRLPISLLAVGRDGWTQIANFVLCGILMVVFAAGLHFALEGRGATWGPIMFALIGMGLVGAGLFATDPGKGFPPLGQAEPGPTLHGHFHDVFSLLVFAGFPAAAFVMAAHFTAYGEHRWAVGTRVCGGVLAVGFVVVLVAFNLEGGLADVAGVIQRVWLAVAFGWLTAVSIDVLQRDATARSLPGRVETGGR